MTEVHKHHQFTAGWQVNELLGTKGNLCYSHDLKSGKFCQ